MAPEKRVAPGEEGRGDRVNALLHFFANMLDTLTADLAHLANTYPDLAASLAGVDGLSGVLHWGVREGLDVAHIEIIVQDEYTHDAILAWRDKFLVFGMT